MNYHRHLTHSLAALPVMALIPVLAVRLFTRKQPFRWLPAYAISLVAVLSHLLLDYTNVYGIRLLLPFSTNWYRLDLTSVVDLWIWAAFLLALTAPMLARLVNSEIGARPSSPGRGFAVFALLFLLVYNCGRAVLHTRAVAALDSRMYAGQSPQRVAAIPGPVNPFAWQGLAETREFYSVHDLNLLEEFEPSRGSIFYKADPVPAVKAANQSPVFRDFFRFSQFPLERSEPFPRPEGATRVEAMDMRFGTPAHPSFIAFAVVGERLNVLDSGFAFGEVRPR
ncbi:MAG: metal-dependent hydrolase [Bryobacteraceae bacterium]